MQSDELNMINMINMLNICNVSGINMYLAWYRKSEIK